MLSGIFYNIVVLGTIMSIIIFPLLIFLSKNKYKYNFKSVYKISIIILLMLIIPINTINFSNIKNIFKIKRGNELTTTQVLEEPQIKFKSENFVVEVNKDIENINVKSNTFFNIYKILPYIWLAVFLCLIIFNFICYIIFLHKLKKDYIDSSNPTTQNMFNNICKNLNLKKVNLKISNTISSPMTIGILRKKVIIPKKIFNDEQYEMIIKHELFHIKNKDIEYKFLLLILNCIYWFNPIVYMFVNQVNEILELNCDEYVLKNQTHKYKISYAEILLNQIEANKNMQFKYSINFANRRKNIMKRFSNIIDNENKKQNIVAIATVTALLLIVSTLLIILIPNINFATSEALESSNDLEVETNLEPIIEESKDLEISNEKFITPLDNYEITKKFDYFSTPNHTGIDLKASSNTEIHSVASGKVIYSGFKGSYGNFIIIEHENGLQTRYAHCAELLKNVGDTVNQGDVIALVGSTGESTGAHLHFEVADSTNTQVDPELYINF